MTINYNKSRRQALKSLRDGCLVYLCLPWISRLKADHGIQKTGEIRGKVFNLAIAKTKVNFTGEDRYATTINGSIPGPTLHWRQGDDIILNVTNHLDEETSLHWHGILLPYQMDGAPDISFNGIAPGETFTYRFQVKQSGTYWYHSHSDMQEQTGLYGAIVIDPQIEETVHADRDYVVLMSDWTDEDPLTVFAKLKKESAYYNTNQPTALQLWQDIREEGIVSAFAKRHMWNMMRMNRTDLADISAQTYTYLLNGHTVNDNWSGLFNSGETIRLRFINASAQSFFDVRIPGLKMTVISADGQAVEPVCVDEFRIGLSETYDVIVRPEQDAYTIFAQSMDRTGYLRGTLARSPGLSGPVPRLDQPDPLEMKDMMGAMQHDHDMASQQGNSDQQAMMGHMHDHSAMHAMPDTSGHNKLVSRHHDTEDGPGVDMRVDKPRTNLDDPGVGLRQNGRRVLTYADLKSVNIDFDKRTPGREIELHLTGNMERYTWSFDGVEYHGSQPIRFKLGECLRVILVNDTMMAHPIHLHGMWSDLENEQGEVQVRKHTIVVQPAQRVTFRVTADAYGRWPWHCHLFYHMYAGMFREVVVL